MDVGSAIRSKKAEVLSVGPDDSVQALAGILHENRLGALAVVDGGGGIVGMISERDLIRGLVENGAGLVKKNVRDLMTADVIACKATDSLADVKAMMSVGHFRHLPVIEDSELVGIITLRDVLDNMLEIPTT